jgi:spore germination protein YaaH
MLVAPAAGAQSPHALVLGYYVPYDATSWASLEAHADQLDVIAAQWASIDACGGITARDDQTLKQFAHAHGIQVVPSLFTLSAELNHQLLADDATRANAIQNIVSYTVDEGYDGFDLDLEGIDPADRAAYSSFVTDLAAALHDHRKLLTLAVPAKERDTISGWAGAFDYAALGAQADLVTVMAYEYNGPFSGPGSVAPFDWVARVTAFASRQIPIGRLLLGLAFYGYDWNTTSGGAVSLGYPRATALASFFQAEPEFDGAQQSLTFGYTAEAGVRAPGSNAECEPRDYQPRGGTVRCRGASRAAFDTRAA